MSNRAMVPAGDENTYDTSDLVIIDCEPCNEPLEEVGLPPGISMETVHLVGRLASQHLPEREKTLVRMMLNGKNKAEIAKELQVTYRELHDLWRYAYRLSRSALDLMPEIGAEVRHWILVKIAHFSNGS